MAKKQSSDNLSRYQLWSGWLVVILFLLETISYSGDTLRFSTSPISWAVLIMGVLLIKIGKR
ncbi:MAG: hypothetical protein NUV97_00905 [archaeon]|nr:hypothetical protein [archaeon]MCR4323480.1 hypothetical protein [Nanoarchaeota archaeon]